MYLHIKKYGFWWKRLVESVAVIFFSPFGWEVRTLSMILQLFTRGLRFYRVGLIWNIQCRCVRRHERYSFSEAAVNGGCVRGAESVLEQSAWLVSRALFPCTFHLFKIRISQNNMAVYQKIATSGEICLNSFKLIKIAFPLKGYSTPKWKLSLLTYPHVVQNP